MVPLNWEQLLGDVALTAKELAARCGVSEVTMKTWLKGAIKRNVVEQRYDPVGDVLVYGLKNKE